MVDRAAAMMVGALCVLGPGVARADDTVPEELLRRPIEASVELRGLAGAPGYGFYLFPVYCTTPLAALDGPAPLISAFMEDEQLGRPNYAELRDGPLAAWIPEGEVCRPSKLYALPRAVAAEVDLPAMSLEALARFFAEDRRVLRGALRLLDDPPEVPPHSRLLSAARRPARAPRPARVRPSASTSCTSAAPMASDARSTPLSTEP